MPSPQSLLPPASTSDRLQQPADSSSLTAWATDNFDDEHWVTLHTEVTRLSSDAFWEVMHSLTVSQHWNRGIYAVTALSHELVRVSSSGDRAASCETIVIESGEGAGPGAPRTSISSEIPSASTPISSATDEQLRYYGVRLLARKSPAPIGGTTEDGRAFDATEWTAQWVGDEGHVATFGLAVPSSVVTPDNPRAMRYWPFQYPKTRAYRFVYKPREHAGGSTDDEGDAVAGDLKFEVVPLGEEASSPRHFEKLEQHAKPAAMKLLTWLRKRMGHIDPNTGLSTYVKRVHHDRLVSEPQFRAWYDRLKLRYGYWVREWPECTDPVKFVHEEMAIAAYLCALWEAERKELGVTALQSFADCGCGNGFLVYLLISEGHSGVGYDLRSRGIWDIYPENVREALRCEPVDPTTFDATEFDWIIGNHSDELSPWLPLIVARAQTDVATREPVELPSTADDAAHLNPSKAQKRHRRRIMSSISGASPPSSSDEEEDDIQAKQSRKLARRAAPRLFVLPCCFFDFDGRKVSFGRTRRTLGVRACGNTGKYEQYWRWIGDIMRATGFVVEVENLRIPSTKYVALLGRYVRHPERTQPDVLKELSHLVLHDAEMSRM